MTDSSSPLDWSPAPPAVTLSLEHVHLWGARLDLPPAELAHLEHLLPAEERARADRFHRPADRARFVAARGLLRLILENYLPGDPAAFRFAAGPQGKPALAPGGYGLDLRFNLSHAAESAIFAVAAGREVGVDLESPARALRGDAVAERYFPVEEAARLRALPEPERDGAFLRSWVCKEAFAKAVGVGLAGLDVRTISLAADPAPPCLHGHTDAARQLLAGWTLLELPPLHGCPAALVVQGTGWQPQLWLWNH